SSRTRARSKPRSPRWASSRSISAFLWFPSRSRLAPACGRRWEHSVSCRAPHMSLRKRVDALAAQQRDRYDDADRTLFAEFRDGAYVAPGVICMPPMYVNVGAYVDAGTMIDSHALVGSCAQIGKRVHLSAAVQVGGVLEPVGALPVIVEDDVLVGGGCGIYE